SATISSVGETPDSGSTSHAGNQWTRRSSAAELSSSPRKKRSAPTQASAARASAATTTEGRGDVPRKRATRYAAADPRRPKTRLRTSGPAPDSASSRTTSAMLLPSVTLTEELYQRSGDESTGRGVPRTKSALAASRGRRPPASVAAPARAPA